MSHASCVGYDGTDGARGRARRARALAAELGDVARRRLRLRRSAGSAARSHDLRARRCASAGARVLEEARSVRPRRAGARSSSSSASSASAEALIEVADEHDARMIVVGSYGERPLKGALVGSTPYRLLHLSSARSWSFARPNDAAAARRLARRAGARYASRSHVVRRSPFDFFSSPLGGNSAWRPRSRKPIREEAAGRSREGDDTTMRARPSTDLRHDPARRRAVARHLAEHEREARDRPAARAPRRRRHRGRASRSPRPATSRPSQAIAREVEGPIIAGLARANAGRHRRARAEAVRDAERPRIHTFISTSDIHIEHQLQSTREDVKGQARAARRAGQGATCDDVEFSPDGRHARRRRVHRRGRARSRSTRARRRSTSPTPSATRCPRSTRPSSTRLYELRAGLRDVVALGALPRRPRPGGGQLVRRRAGRRAPGRVRDQRHRRARRQRVARGDRDAAAHARGRRRPDTRASTRARSPARAGSSRA